MAETSGHATMQHHSRSSSIHDSTCGFFPSDEDWSHIEDKAARRRVQNKAAQRRFRRKMRSQSSSSDQQLETLAISSSAGSTENTENLVSNVDLLRLSNQQQNRSDSSTQEGVPSLIWNSSNSLASHETSNHAFVTYMRRGQEDVLLPHPNSYLSAESVSPRLSSEKRIYSMAEDSARRLAEPDLLGQNHLAASNASSNTRVSGQSLSANQKNRHAERLVSRIHNTLDELSMLYKIGIDLELMQKDDNMSAHLEALKTGFYNLASPST